MRRVLVPLDGAQLDESVAAAIPQVTGSRDVEVVLIRVLQPPSADSIDGSGDALLNRMVARIEEATTAIARTAVFLRAHVRQVTTVVRYGAPVAEILDAARQLDVDFIAMRPYGRHGRHDSSFNLVAEGVLRNAGIPVLMIPAAPRAVAAQREHGRKLTARRAAA